MLQRGISEEEIAKIAGAYPRDRRYSLAILQDIQRRFNHIPRESFGILSRYLDIRPAGLYSMATFYRALSLKPKGRYVIKVCDGTACHIRGAPVLLEALQRSLGIRAGETTGDGLFSIDTVGCLGTCAIAPVMVVGEKYFSKVRPDEVEGILDGYREEARKAEEGGNG